MIAEVLSPKFGVGIAIGWASLYSVNIICVHKPENKISNSLEKVCGTFIKYNTTEELVERLSKLLIK